MSMYIYPTTPKFCTYLTIYSGNKLPMFYIGSSSVNKVLNENYHGSVTSKKYKDTWKQEIKQNPHLFKTKILKEFHSRKNATYHERKLQVKLNIVRSPMYINMAIASVNGFFGMDLRGKFVSEESKRKMSEYRIGKLLSEETKQKISNKNKGRILSKETKQNMSKARKGKPLSIEHRNKLSIAFKGRVISDEQKIKTSESLKGIPHKIITCPHCGKEGGQSAMKRHHFDNCKNHNNLIIPIISTQNKIMDDIINPNDLLLIEDQILNPHPIDQKI